MSNSNIEGTLNSYQSYALGLLRIVSAYIFMLHGSAKLLHFPHIEMFDSLEIFSLYGFAGILELVGGLLLLVGLKTRFVAFILAGEMAAAYFKGHATAATVLFPVLNSGDAAILYTFVFLYFVFAGGGAWSLDNLFKKN